MAPIYKMMTKVVIRHMDFIILAPGSSRYMPIQTEWAIQYSLTIKRG